MVRCVNCRPVGRLVGRLVGIRCVALQCLTYAIDPYRDHIVA